MRTSSFWIAASCILALVSLRPLFSSGASPASAYKIVYSFSGGSDGAYPVSDLTFDAAGNLYGTTEYGGTGTCKDTNGVGCGTVFQLKRAGRGWKEEVLYSFQAGNDGAFPTAGVVFDGKGNLYGPTAGGGSGYNSGTVFKLTPNAGGGWTESTIYRGFNCYGAVGCGPAADLILDGQGNLYGTTPGGGNGMCLGNGCGAVFKLTPGSNGSWDETTLHSFADVPDGGIPIDAVVVDSEGSVYGLTSYGGTGTCRPLGGYGGIMGCGTLYKLTPDSVTTWTESILYNFVRGGGSGIYPSGALFFDSPDHWFGMTQHGGDRCGTVFDLQNTKKQSWQQSQLHIFSAQPDGCSPVGRLVKDANGNLFGVTTYGGAENANGTVFELQSSRTGWTEKILHGFSGSLTVPGPLAGLVSDGHGHLYGTTEYGGIGIGCAQGCGTVYEVTP